MLVALLPLTLQAEDSLLKSWVWSQDSASATQAAPVGERYFRRAFEVQKPLKKAICQLTADNEFLLYVNGKEVWFSKDWKQLQSITITQHLRSGRNVVAVKADNWGPAANPAGLIGAVSLSFADGTSQTLYTDENWVVSSAHSKRWQMPEFDDSSWLPALVVGRHGCEPWGVLEAPQEGPQSAHWPEAVAFLADDCSILKAHLKLFRVGKSRAYSMFDVPVPSLMARKLCVLRPARPGAKPRVLFDAGQGSIGSPCVSFDGRHIYFSMAKEDDKFYRIYRISVNGGEPERLTHGPFHDLDPAELPDGRIVFSSTRIGFLEEYHSGPARALFAMNRDGSGIKLVTPHIIFDNDPCVMSDGRIAFVRSDNFWDTPKIETHIHATLPDGTAGAVILGPPRMTYKYKRSSPFNSTQDMRRKYSYGSPAPLPGGRVAAVSQKGVVTERSGGSGMPMGLSACDVSPLPDGRLLYTTADQDAIGTLDPETGKVNLLYSTAGSVHSPIYLGPRQRPPVLGDTVNNAEGISQSSTGFILCQNVFNTRQTEADWKRVRAIRVYEGQPLTHRSSGHQVLHIGTIAVELGTVPIAPDGSFFAEVPADRPFAMQAVDAEGRAIVDEMSWIYVRPGEVRSCVGCHARKGDTPKQGFRGSPQAIRSEPAKLLGLGRPHRWRANLAAQTGILDLSSERMREIASVDIHGNRAEDAEGIAPELADQVQALTKSLRDSDAALRISSAQRLAILRDRAAAPELAGTLRDPVREVRMHAAFALAACGDRQSIGPLAETLDDPDALVAQAAHVALENLTGHTEAFDPFRDPPGKRKGAEAWRKWMRTCDWSRVEQELIVRLDSADPLARHRAIVALGHTGDTAARNALREFLSSKKVNADLRATREAIRALGHLKATEAVGLLGDLLIRDLPTNRKGRSRRSLHDSTRRAEAVAEALGHIGTEEAEDILVDTYGRLGAYWTYNSLYGDHVALIACHASPIHYRITEALNSIGSTKAAAIVPKLLASIPTDPDRALLFENDACEVMTARLVRLSGMSERVITSCLLVLQGKQNAVSQDLMSALTIAHKAWAGRPLSEARAAQILSIVCNDAKYAPEVRSAFDRYRALPAPKLKDPTLKWAPCNVKHWTCFYLARLLGKLRDRAAVETLTAALTEDPTEASFGRPNPPEWQVLFLHNAPNPCYRAAAADALGRIGDRSAVPTLLKAAANFDNALDVRHAAAMALGRIADPSSVQQLRELAKDYPEVSTRRALLTACETISAE
jgi:HEAT repeat protein